jgi:Tol biopolymer transport system component
VDENPFKITTLLPLSDNVPYQVLGSGKIVFERNYNQGKSLLYVIDIDKRRSFGFELKSLIAQPNISPDGSKIVCSLLNSADLNPAWNIYIMNIDGSDCYPAFQSDKGANYPALNYDGSKILFYTNSPDGRLYMQSLVEKSSDRVELTKFHYDDDPQSLISPSGGFTVSSEGDLAGVSNSENLSGIIGIIPYIGKAGASVLVSPLTDLGFVSPNFRVESPVFSPDGLKIAFISIYTGPLETSGMSVSIYTMDPDGTNLTAIGGMGGSQPKLRSGRYMSLCWSPDETKILFALPDGETTCHLYVVNLDGSGFNQITNQLNVFDSNVSWSR